MAAASTATIEGAGVSSGQARLAAVLARVRLRAAAAAGAPAPLEAQMVPAVTASERHEPQAAAIGGKRGAAASEALADEGGAQGGSEKRRRVVAVASGTASAAEVAADAMCCSFGYNWRSRFHASHRLSYAHPLVFCTACGHHCDTPQHLTELGRACTGVPARGSVYISRLEAIRRGRHPITREELAPPAPLVAGTKKAQ